MHNFVHYTVYYHVIVKHVNTVSDDVWGVP